MLNAGLEFFKQFINPVFVILGIIWFKLYQRGIDLDRFFIGTLL